MGFEGFEGDQGSRFSGIDRPPDLDEAEIEERKGISAGSVPEPYLARIRRMTHKYVEGQVRFSYDNQ